MVFPSRHDPDKPLDGLAARLRALPEPAVPPGLEGRLLASLNAILERRRLRRRRVGWAVAAGAGIAACVAGLVIGPQPFGKSRRPQGNGLAARAEPGTRTAERRSSHRESASFHGANGDSLAPPQAVSRASRGDAEAPYLPRFQWPVQERSPLTASITAVGRVLD
jgi:hypothetical protein